MFGGHETFGLERTCHGDLVVNRWMFVGGRDSRREGLVSGPQVVGGEEVPDCWAG